MKRFVIYTADLGVYIDRSGDGAETCWTAPDRECDSFVPNFASPAAASAHVATWKGPAPLDWRAVEVEADGAGYVTLAACVAAGLPESSDDAWENVDASAQWASAAKVLTGGRAS